MDDTALLAFLMEQSEEHLLDIEDTESDLHPETQWVYSSHAVIRTAMLFVEYQRGKPGPESECVIEPSSSLGILGRLDETGQLKLSVQNLLDVNHSILYHPDHESTALIGLAKEIAEKALMEVNETASLKPLVREIRSAICETWQSYFSAPAPTSFLNRMGESRGEILQFLWIWLIGLAHELE